IGYLFIIFSMVSVLNVMLRAQNTTRIVRQLVVDVSTGDFDHVPRLDAELVAARRDVAIHRSAYTDEIVPDARVVPDVLSHNASGYRALATRLASAFQRGKTDNDD